MYCSSKWVLKFWLVCKIFIKISDGNIDDVLHSKISKNASSPSNLEEKKNTILNLNLVHYKYVDYNSQSYQCYLSLVVIYLWQCRSIVLSLQYVCIINNTRLPQGLWNVSYQINQCCMNHSPKTSRIVNSQCSIVEPSEAYGSDYNLLSSYARLQAVHFSINTSHHVVVPCRIPNRNRHQ